MLVCYARVGTSAYPLRLTPDALLLTLTPYPLLLTLTPYPSLYGTRTQGPLSIGPWPNLSLSLSLSLYGT